MRIGKLRMRMRMRLSTLDVLDLNLLANKSVFICVIHSQAGLLKQCEWQLVLLDHRFHLNLGITDLKIDQINLFFFATQKYPYDLDDHAT